MKWSDLESGDVIKVTEQARIKGHYTSDSWANKDLTISKVYMSDSDSYDLPHVVIWCDNNQYRFNILLNGCHMCCEELGTFFDIVKLRE